MNVHLSSNSNTVSRTERKYHGVQQARLSRPLYSSKMAEPHVFRNNSLRGSQLIDHRSKL